MKAKKKVRGTTLHIPHIDYVVVVENKKKEDIATSAAYTKRMHSGESLIVVPLPISGPKKAGILVHEIVHVLQNICDGSNMAFTYEREHMAYIAGWLFDEISKL